MNYKVKALCAAAVFALPGAAHAEAIAVALSAAMQPVYITGSTTVDITGDVTLPALDLDGTAYVCGFGVCIPTGPVDGTTTGGEVVPIDATGTVTFAEYDGNRLSAISVAAASGRTAVASTAANNAGSTAANSGATDSRRATLSASSHSWGGEAYTSRVNIR